MNMTKQMVLAALAAMGMSSPEFATTAPEKLKDFLPNGLGKKKIKPRSKRNGNLWSFNTPAIKPKREYKDRHKKGRP